ncbi:MULTISPECIES: tRNA (adenosine(37)-N6)-threonylcarbamoyltransferase complex transferase subunit TsaD [unclassified Treponema]|uniref:tRNA (adenosine(37)-N6)-threonylcarbamoyltransferase complex transferase subunit TsaD n=1 Tax=unclassified Treponema TaxID=2638727 RepID=UPI0020A29F4F|nr:MULTISPECIES: tRNA (adenosine(37)-N6)-threonylcarbamoyltransferase complex transferase subunit TsaD [unclassified Treponema]UTC67399.1 tRNA (adenosine(37)-N6)-threonylcarbamoyltransferase complex transferase subunit TsaD [Treponema sp. OMZ 789]UTC70127.1 tRNA (adenosine(37)-N6)-threonylcarbamoyltransferase complex transferase subunit TsaD [Treponema sp. OMZ 790]UTC72842.1 tRNA (adenosine(37)-N6)-threonylcarbamoyltransferase complex transferase subunit TsaD [Treponema sp. OMZ 791]
MKILGIESSCDETAAAVVEDGNKILSNIVATQIPFHKMYNGVVPEIASRKHTEWILPIVKQALAEADLSLDQIDGIAATGRPGLMGSLLVGLTFAKTLAWSSGKPFIAVNHMLGHLYASHLEHDIPYPYLGLLVSGGHSIICKVNNFDDIEVLGTTIDDAPGEAFDKVAKFYNLGYPGGAVIDKLAKTGNPKAANFPMPIIHKEGHKYDVSYSGLKTAVINQIDQFWNKDFEKTPENIAAAFQTRAVKILLRPLLDASIDTSLKTIVAGGGVAANSLLREKLAEHKELKCIFPSLKFCTDNAAMIAGLGYHYLKRGDRTPFTVEASARVEGFSKKGRR